MARPPAGQSWSVTIRCSHCARETRKPRSHRTGREAFCSMQCYGAWKRGRPVFDREYYRQHGKRYAGERNPNWKGGKERNDRLYREWVARNLESVLQRCAQRRAMKRAAPGRFTLAEWETLKARHGHRCVRCGRPESEVKLTRDHIVPLSKGGSNFITNIQPLCKSCNSSKKDKLETAA